MSQTVTLQVPDDIVQRAAEIARRSNTPLETVLVEWLNRSAGEVPPEQLSDVELLVLLDSQIDERLQAEMNDLLALNEDGQLDEAGQRHLDELHDLVHAATLRKAEAYAIAIKRGLRPPFSQRP